MSAAVFEERIDPGRTASTVLSLVVHLALLAVLIFGVRWQNRPPEIVSVELWDAPQPVVKPEPPKPVEPPKPEPRVEAPPPKPEPRIEKPDIVEKAQKPKPEIKKPAPKPETKPAPLKPRVDENQRRQELMREQALREQASLALEKEQSQIRDQLARETVAGNSKALQTWMGKIQSQIKSRIAKPIADAVPGNPKAVFAVTLLPTCEVLDIVKQQSSGNLAYDEEVERAIRKSSPLPKPDKQDVFNRRLELTFRPKDPI